MIRTTPQPYGYAHALHHRLKSRAPSALNAIAWSHLHTFYTLESLTIDATRASEGTLCGLPAMNYPEVKKAATFVRQLVANSQQRVSTSPHLLLCVILFCAPLS